MNFLYSRTFRISLIYVFILIFIYVLIRNSWVCDDAYISFRVVENFLNGYGLNWNIAERVQVYTNPLWTFLFTIPYIFTREAYFTTIVLSTVVSLSVVLLFAYNISKATILAVAGILLMFLSKAFIDFSSSGLENPLTHLILIVFIIALYKVDYLKKPLFVVSLLASLAMLNRMDTLLFFLPVLIYLFWKNRTINGILEIIKGFLPIILWILFCLFYYGTAVPNTALAKLNVMLPLLAFIDQGFKYFIYSTQADPLTSIVIVSGMLLAIIFGRKEERLVVTGSTLYIIYILRIGGDFMSGRMLTPVFLCSLVMLVLLAERIRKPVMKYAIAGACTALLLVVGLISERSPLYVNTDVGDDFKDCILGAEIVDEKCWYFQGAGLINYKPGKNIPDHYFRDRAEQNSDKVVEFKTIGYFGFFSEPDVHVVDNNALADPLLARIPLINKPWRIGHFERNIPEGYLESLQIGRNVIGFKPLREYYGKIRLVTRGKLFSWERIKTIFVLNTGGYNYLMDKYIKWTENKIHSSL